MSYKYYAYVPIGWIVMDTTCLVRRSPGVFEKYVKGEWIESREFYGILVGEDDNYEQIDESLANKIISEGKL